MAGAFASGSRGFTMQSSLNSCRMTSSVWQHGQVTSMGRVMGATMGLDFDVVDI